MGAEGRSLGLGIDMAQAGARSGYDRDRFGYNAANQRQLYDDDLQRQMLDYSRRNQVDDSNLMSQNAWMAGLTSPLMQLLSGQNGLDLSGIGGLI